jgi:hypothetical protein
MRTAYEHKLRLVQSSERPAIRRTSSVALEANIYFLTVPRPPTLTRRDEEREAQLRDAPPANFGYKRRSVRQAFVGADVDVGVVRSDLEDRLAGQLDLPYPLPVALEANIYFLTVPRPPTLTRRDEERA